MCQFDVQSSIHYKLRICQTNTESVGESETDTAGEIKKLSQKTKFESSLCENIVKTLIIENKN